MAARSVAAGKWRVLLVSPILVLNYTLPLIFKQAAGEDVIRATLLLALSWLGSFKVNMLCH